MAFRTAERKKAKLRLGLVGPSGSGKTYSSLLIAKGIGGRIALIDTENGSGDLYAGMKDIPQYDISTMSAPYTVEKYLEAIKEAEQAGYSVIIIDSLSHAWAGEGGLLDKQGKIADSGRGNSYTAWRQVTPLHNQLIEKMLTSPCHIIATMRTKVDYVVEADSKGKQVPKKIGLAPIQREGMDYEFTVVFDIDLNHNAQVSKDRTASFDGQIFKPGEETGSTLKAWLDTGSDNIGAEKPITTKSKTAPKEKTAEREYLINALKDITLQGLGFKPEELAPWLKRILEREDITGFDSMSDTELITAVNTAQTELKNRG